MTTVHSEVHPARTFPDTRRVTLDGVPANWAKSGETLARKADKEFAKHRHVPSWALPCYGDRPASHDRPIGYRPQPEHDESDDLSQLLTALTAEGAK